MIASVVGHRSAVGRDRGIGFSNHQGTIDKAQVVVAVCAAGAYRIAACVLFSARRTHACEHGLRLAGDQASGGKATHRLVGAVVSDRATVGGDGGIGFVHRVGAVPINEVVVPHIAGAQHRSRRADAEVAGLGHAERRACMAAGRLSDRGQRILPHQAVDRVAGAIGQGRVGGHAVVGGGSGSVGEVHRLAVDRVIDRVARAEVVARQRQTGCQGQGVSARICAGDQTACSDAG